MIHTHQPTNVELSLSVFVLTFIENVFKELIEKYLIV